MPKKVPPSEVMDKFIRFRLRPDVYEAAERVAAQMKTMGVDSVNEYARVLLLRDLEIRGKLPPGFRS